MTEGQQHDEMKLYQTFRISYDLNFNSTFSQMSMGEKKKHGVLSLYKNHLVLSSFALEEFHTLKLLYLYLFLVHFLFFLSMFGFFFLGICVKNICGLLDYVYVLSTHLVTIFSLFHKTLKLLCSRIMQTSCHVLLKNLSFYFYFPFKIVLFKNLTSVCSW